MSVPLAFPGLSSVARLFFTSSGMSGREGSVTGTSRHAILPTRSNLVDAAEASNPASNRAASPWRAANDLSLYLPVVTSPPAPLK